MAHHPKYIITVDELSKLTGHPVHDILPCFDQQDVIKMSGGNVGIPPHKTREYLSQRGVDYSFKVIAHINLKGGTGKTISAISVATRVVQYGFKTCIVDLDSQGSASLAFNMVPAEDDPIFCDVWQRPAEMVMGALKSIEEYLYILPSSLENGLLDIHLMNPVSQKNAVRGVCKELKTHGFDIVMIDCPPSLGTAVISTICAANIIIIPVCCDAFSLKGLKLTLNEISAICETFNLEQPVIKILYTKFDKRVKIALDVSTRLSSQYKDYLIPFPIRTSTEFAKALEEKMTVFASSRKSHAKEDYDLYVRELLGINPE
jgi:chromosome partitioning protein